MISTAMATEHILQPGYNFGDEFEIGLDLILGALAEGISQAAPATSATRP